MNIDYLKEFVELSRQRTLTDAASSLHIHQSTLSKHLIALEKEFSATLIDRNKNGLCLTDQGFFFMGCASAMIDLYESTLEGLRGIAERHSLRLGYDASDSSLASLLSMATVLYHDANSRSIQTVHGIRGHLFENLASGKIDIAVSGEPETALEGYGFEKQLLLSSPAVALVERSHRLAQRDTISIDDLKNETLIKLLSDDAQAGWQVIQTLCEKRGFEPKTRPVLTPSTIENLSTPLNNCVLLFPGRNKEISFLSQLKKYACIPLADDDAVFPIFAAWMPDKTAEVAPFLKVLDEALAIMSTPA